MKNGDIIQFDRKKDFKYIKPLGSGGTGDTHLFEDETTELLFAFKKYSPKNINYISEYYDRFVDEIKILFNISHPNIVRVYNYYLYPESKIGYLQMEYIDGVSINEYDYNGYNNDWNDIFKEVIIAFEYLEEKNILHRDIRPANILINNFGNIKVIDFGFGKKLEKTEKEGHSVLLNWPVTYLPVETIIDGTYNHQTEVYFVGKLFKSLSNKLLDGFRYSHIIDKMCQEEPANRYKSFLDISQDISIGVLSEMTFTSEDKKIYQVFSKVLFSKINHYVDSYNPINDSKVTIDKLAELIRKSSLEDYIQNNSDLIGCFITGGYNYNTLQDIEVTIVKDFYRMLIKLNSIEKKIVFDNIYTKLRTRKIEYSEDELPF